MISRTVRLQLTIFAVITLVGTAFVGLRYVGLGDALMGNSYLVHANFTSSGGLFTNASVTYRGVPVGRVGALTPTPKGVRVELRLDRGIEIPEDLRAVTTNRSAIGEQHIDLRPNTDAGPYLKSGDVIPNSRTGIPLPVERLVFHLDNLARSVDPEDLAIVVDELGRAFEGNEEALGRLLDASDLLLTDAREHLPETIALIRDGRTALETQELSGDAIRRWAAGLATLTKAVADADPDIRKILADGPPAAKEVVTLVRDLEPNVGALLGNLITVNGIATRRIAGMEALLIELPLAIAGGYTVAPGDGTAHFGLVLNFDDPPPCVYKNSGKPPHCSDGERSKGSSVRGWQNAGRPPGPEISPAPYGAGEPPKERGGSGAKPDSGDSGSDTSVASYDPATGLIVGPDGQPLEFGGTGGQYALLGSESWKDLLYSGIAG
ncbi:MAG: MCE family protein [Micromonosporaceae bacterium]